jgi:lipopolysaccharide/colanic/teichoic acid biosynthesis glycosyltransferase
MIASNRYIQLIVVHKDSNFRTNIHNGLLRFAISNEPIAGIVLDGLSRNFSSGNNTNVVIAVPEEWNIKSQRATPKITHYREDVPVDWESLRKTKKNSWFVISNGRFATQISGELLHKVLAVTPADMILINATADLLAYREKVRFTAQGNVAGFRRLYSDSVEPAPLPADWPHHIFIKTNVLDQVLADRTLPQSFSTFLEKCQSNALSLCAINVGGTVLDLETEDKFLDFCKTRVSSSLLSRSYEKIMERYKGIPTGRNNKLSHDSRFIGKVFLGNNVHIGPKVIVVGPTIIGNDVRIGPAAFISSAILGPGVCVPPNQLVQNRVITEFQCNWKHLSQHSSYSPEQISLMHFKHLSCNNDTFRVWPTFSYARCFKRIADVIAAVIVLVLFVPIIPFIAIAIKLNSRGPVFFKDKRQGLVGKEFYCPKFRTMITGADRIQDKLRIVNQADGPQFRIEDDPRTSAVGRFLRDTYIDEIPQFFNVLIGQMSVIGPRPSPKQENTLCPVWRDARLSVRPGITGLWQVCRTRQPMKDFQEWIYYDVKYVKKLSLKMDLWICWKTVKKIVGSFISQF